MCQCKQPDCKIHRERACGMVSRLDGRESKESETLIPLCVPCAGHSLTKGWRLRARPGDNLGR